MLRGYSFNGTADYELVREIKEDLCYVSINLKKERLMAKDTTVLDKEYKLPDGKTIIVGRERFEAAEILMNPALIELEDDGLAAMVYNSIVGCPMDI
jgi:actin-related protein 2